MKKRLIILSSLAIVLTFAVSGFLKETKRKLAQNKGTVEERLASLEDRVSVLENLTQKPIACNNPAADLRNAPIGFKCITTKGAVFERVERENFGEAWKDPNGLIWSEVMDKKKISRLRLGMSCSKTESLLDFPR